MMGLGDDDEDKPLSERLLDWWTKTSLVVLDHREATGRKMTPPPETTNAVIGATVVSLAEAGFEHDDTLMIGKVLMWLLDMVDTAMEVNEERRPSHLSDLEFLEANCLIALHAEAAVIGKMLKVWGR